MKRSVLLAVVCFFACVAETPVFDQVMVEIEDFIEYRDEYGSVGRVVLVVKNATEVPVYSAAISIRLETDSHRYYTTVYDDSGVPPKTKVYITVEFAYLSLEERAVDTGIEITDSFFM